MVDLPLMAKLTCSLEEGSRLLLLGDKDQLASVEPGAVFGDICDTDSINIFSSNIAGTVKDLLSVELPHRESQENTVADSIVVLTKSYRFGSESGIGLLASAVKECRFSDAFGLIKDTTHNDIRWQEVPTIENLEEAIEEKFYSFYSDYLAASSPQEAFSLFDRFHILCALRHGPYGAISLNWFIEHMCRRMGLIPKVEGWYKCEPVMITMNDYHLRLFNGDVGIVFPDQDAEKQLRVFFPADGGGYRKLLPGRLKNYETVYAMTVHKSQGSEFPVVIMTLVGGSPLFLNRKLLYTAVTRAKKMLVLVGSYPNFARMIHAGTANNRRTALVERIKMYSEMGI